MKTSRHLFTLAFLTLISLFIQSMPLHAEQVATYTAPNGTSVSLNLSGDKGVVEIEAECFFPEIKGSLHPYWGNIWGWDFGTCSVEEYMKDHGFYSRNCSTMGNGNVKCTLKRDFATLPQGEWKFRGYAYSYSTNSRIITEVYPVNIDNTPKITIETNESEGLGDVGGTIQFNPVTYASSRHYEGQVWLEWLEPDAEQPQTTNKTIRTDSYDPIPWSMEEYFGDVFDTGNLKQGTHTITIKARAWNGAYAEKTSTFNFNNKPELTANVSSKEDGTVDINGTVMFPASKGELSIKWTTPDDNVFTVGPHSFDSSGTIQWTWEDLSDTTIYAAQLAQGTHTLTFTAKGNNDAEQEVTRTLEIDNTPVLMALLVNSNGVFGSSVTSDGEIDIRGSVQLKPLGSSAAGELYLTWIKPDGTKLYNKTKIEEFQTDSFNPVQWSWGEFKYYPLETCVMKEGIHTFTLQARSYNNTWSEPVELTLNVSNTPKLTANIRHQNDGKIDISGTVEFKSCSSRSRTGELSVTWTSPSGNVTTIPSFGPLSFTSSGTKSWTWEDLNGGIIDAGQLKQGEHKLTFLAKAYNGAEKILEGTIDIDNTPLVNAYIEGTEGEIKLYGSVDFKPVVDPSVPEGTFYLDVSSPSGEDYATYRDSFSTNFDWDWESLNKGNIIDAGILEKGEYPITARAQAHNGAWSDTVEQTLNVDNTPEVTIDKMTVYQNGNSYKSAVFDIEGTIRFKEVVSSYDGTLKLYVGEQCFGDHFGGAQYLGEIKYDDQHTVGTWRLSDFTDGSLLKLAQYPDTVCVSAWATAYNEQWLNAMRTFYSDCFAADSTMSCDDDIETVSKTDPNKKLDELEDSLPEPAVEHGKPFGNEDSLPDPAIEHGKPFGKDAD